MARHVAEGLGLADLVVMHHGAIVYDFAQDEMLFHNELTKETALEVIQDDARAA